MTQASLVLLNLAATVALFATDRLRVDFVAVLSFVALVASGALSTGEALAGFAAPIVVMIGALFIVGEGLTTRDLPRAWPPRLPASADATSACCFRR